MGSDQHFRQKSEPGDKGNVDLTPFMRLGFFTMPLHPRGRDPAVTLQEDREAIILADRLGFHDAFVGEHLTDPEENVTNSFIFLASLVAETRTVKLGTRTSNLPQS